MGIKCTVTPLCFKCGEHGYYAIVCPSEGLHFCIDELKSKLESYLKEEDTCNEDELNKECNCYDGMMKGYILVVPPRFAPQGKGRRRLMV